MKDAMRKLLVLLVLMFAPCAYGQEPVRVAAASNLSAVLDALVREFQKQHADTRVELVFGSSGKLTAQLLQGAPFDIFMAADMEYPAKIHAKGLSCFEPVCYAEGRLILFTNRSLPLQKCLAVTALPEVARIAVANPELAPYGRAAVEALERTGMLDDVRSKFVYAANISEVFNFTVAGADVGLTSLALLQSPEMRRYNVKGKHWVEVDPALHAPIRQGMLLLASSRDKAGARVFYEFILSQKAKKVFRGYGYR